ncbi:MAG: CBS domain-containing protein [Firmicutes bacterium]|nr:CBS domain-containing protein [Bacillota bacterium]
MNLIRLLTPKSTVAYLNADMTLRQALEKMEYHRYQAVPILDDDGKYVGVLTEGDVLWEMKRNPHYSFMDTEDIGVMDIPRYWQYRPVAITEAMDTLVQAAAVQSFIPVVDDGGYFIGIIKRSDIINYCYGRMSEE